MHNYGSDVGTFYTQFTCTETISSSEASRKPDIGFLLHSALFSALNFAFLEHPEVECGKPLGCQLIHYGIFGELAVLNPRVEFISAEHNHFKLAQGIHPPTNLPWLYQNPEMCFLPMPIDFLIFFFFFGLVSAAVLKLKCFILECCFLQFSFCSPS